jgi:hypothetical protein
MKDETFKKCVISSHSFFLHVGVRFWYWYKRKRKARVRGCPVKRKEDEKEPQNPREMT